MPLRSTILDVGGGALAIVSPVRMDDAMATEVERHGRVLHLIAPNCLHHTFLEEAMNRWPQAAVHAAPGLERKHPVLRDATRAALPTTLEAIALEGTPFLSETVFVHRESRSLVVTDLVFNIRETRGLVTPLILRMAGANGRLAQSRAIRFMVNDRALAGQSARRILASTFDRVVMAHGEVLTGDAKGQLEKALWWMLSA